MNKVELRISCKVDVDEVIETLYQQLGENVLFYVLTQIDSYVGDSDFTKSLRDYFIKEVEEEEKYNTEQ